jgi:hypothetical protein
MLSRALDQIFYAASVLPSHLETARRVFANEPERVAALDRLEAALKEAQAALGRSEKPRAA